MVVFISGGGWCWVFWVLVDGGKFILGGGGYILGGGG